MALFPHDKDKQLRWLLATIDKASIHDEWHELEGAVRRALEITYIRDEDVEHERWTIKREREDAELSAEVEEMTKPKTEPVLCEKCRAEIEPEKRPKAQRAEPLIWYPGNGDVYAGGG